MYINWAVKSGKRIKVSNKDMLLLQVIATNPRLSLKKIGEKMRISKVAVFNRIKNLEKKEIITGYSCFIDFRKIGFNIYQIGIKTNMTIEQKEEFINAIKEKDFVNQILVLSGGRWDFLIRLACKEEKFDDCIDVLSGKDIQKLEVLEISHALVMKDDQEKECFTRAQESLTKKEIDLLFELAKNSNQKLVTLAQKTGMNTKTIIKKIKELETKKIIISFVTEYNPLILGNEAYLLLVTTKKRIAQKKIAKELLKLKSTGVLLNYQNPNIISYHTISTLEDIKTIEKTIKQFTNEITQYEFIKVEEQIKYTFFLKELMK